MKKKLDAVLSGDTFAGKSAAQMAEQEDRPVAAAPTFASKPAPAPKAVTVDDDEDVMAYFNKIAQES